jgi:hypothetical protein
MTTEQTGSTESSEQPTGGAAEPQQQNENLTPPPAPREAPPAGTQYVFDPKLNVWHLRRDPNYQLPEARTQEPQEREPGDETEEESPAGEVALEIPGHIPTAVQESEEVQGALHELGGILREQAISPEVGQSYVDIYAGYAMESPAGEVDALNPDAMHAQLRALWGETYNTRWANVQKAWRSFSPPTQDWIANHAEHPIAMFRTLAAIGAGTFKLSRAQAQEAITKMRADRKSPLFDVAHKEHRLYTDTYRNLTLVANRPDVRKGREGSVEEMVADKTAVEAKAKGKKSGEMSKLDDEIQKIRMDPEYHKSGPAQRVLAERMRELYRMRYPD